MSLTTAICISLLVGLGVYVLGLIGRGDQIMRERDWAEGKETPPGNFPSHEAKQGLKWFFVAWGVTAAFISILCLQRGHPFAPGAELMGPEGQEG